MKLCALIITFILIFGFSPCAKACYGELCSTSAGALYDYPSKYINKYTKLEYVEPELILNDPKTYFEQYETKLPIKACTKKKKRCIAVVRL